MPIDLTVSLINHSNPDLLRECLRSLYANTRRITFDVWIVDNATDGRGVEQMQSEFPQVKWLFNDRRLGFSANHNQVLSRSTGRYACILNDDTVIHDRALDILVDYMDGNPDVGMAGPRLLNEDGTLQNCAFRFMSLWSEFIGIMLLPRALCGLKKVGIHGAQENDLPTTVDWVLGACLIVRDATLHDVGLLDSELSPIANTEEVDWCFRCRRAGWKVAYCPDAVLTHLGGRSTANLGDDVDSMRVEMHRTRLAFFRKHHGVLAAQTLRGVYCITLPWNAFMLMQGLLRHTISFARYRAALRTLRRIAAQPVPTISRMR